MLNRLVLSFPKGHAVWQIKRQLDRLLQENKSTLDLIGFVAVAMCAYSFPVLFYILSLYSFANSQKASVRPRG